MAIHAAMRRNWRICLYFLLVHEFLSDILAFRDILLCFFTCAIIVFVFLSVEYHDSFDHNYAISLAKLQFITLYFGV